MPFFVSAQELQTPPEPSIAMPQEVAGTINCFDYYKFGSVQVDVESSVTSTVSGVPITFKATIKNDNNYPIVQGSVYAKVFKKQTDKDQAHSNGNYLVDQFFVQENISLNSKESKLTEFNWQVPAWATTGDYQIAMFFTSAKKFNLLGLSFTDDVVGNTMDFAVSGEVTQVVQFDKNTVNINGTNYHFAAYPPRFKEEDIIIKADLVNATAEPQAIPVIWKLYAWDGQSEDNLLNTKEETVQLNSNETKQIAYTITAKDSPVYYLVAQAKYQDTKSILDIRTIRGEVNKTRINFPAITSYPLKQDESNTLFVCAHNSGTADVVDNNKLVVTILDENQEEIHKYNYEGQISGAMMGLKDEFTPKETYANFSIKTELYTNNQLVDQAIMKYDCNEIDKNLCPVKSSMNNTIGVGSIKAEAKSILAIIFLIIVVVVIVVVLIGKRNGKLGMFLLAFFVSGMLLGGGEVEAASTVVHTDFVGVLVYEASSPSWNGTWYFGLSNPSVDAHYEALVYNDETNQLIGQNAIIPVGTKLRFEQILGTVTFNGTGTTWDTPIGEWIAGANFPDGPTSTFVAAGYTFREGQCTDKYRVTTISGGTYGGIEVYTPFSAELPMQSISRDNASQARLNCAGNVCTVISAGAINTDFVFSDTYGYFYYEYKAPSSFKYPGCHTSWNIGPMRRYSSCSFGICSAQDASSGKINIPTKTIPYNLTAVSAGNFPAIPTITGPVTGLIGTSYGFTTVSGYPYNGDLRYGIDWDNNNIVDQWTPFVGSGTAQTSNREWAVMGPKTLKALACDNNGSCSGWSAPHTIVISEPIPPVAPTVDLKINNSDNAITVNKFNPIDIDWSSVNAISCSGSGTNWITTSLNGSQHNTNISMALPKPANASAPPTIINYTFACSNAVGSVTDIVPVEVICDYHESAWGACDKSCGDGKMHRTITHPNCFTSEEEQDCNLGTCPDSVNFREVGN